jgi:hypothetical protein
VDGLPEAFVVMVGDIVGAPVGKPDPVPVGETVASVEEGPLAEFVGVV